MVEQTETQTEELTDELKKLIQAQDQHDEPDVAAPVEE